MAKPSPAARAAIEAKMRKLTARRNKLTADYRAAMEQLWTGDVPPEQWRKTKAAYDAEDDALDDAINVLDWQSRGSKPPKEVMARVQPALLKGPQSAATKCVTVKAPLASFDRRSIRTLVRGSTRILVGCPVHQWQPRKARCRVGTRAYEVIRPAVRGRCPAGSRAG